MPHSADIADHPIADHPISIILASASPRRAEILRALGIPFRVDPSSVAEELLPGETGDAAARRLAAAKASEVTARHPAEWVLAADTLVLVDGETFGKPRDDAEAAMMLRRIAGRDHRVVTAVELARGFEVCRSAESSVVRIAPLTPQEIAWYVATGEPRDKAGAYAVQGLGARFIEGVQGSYTNVMGLPARTVYRLMREEAGDPALALLALSSP